MKKRRITSKIKTEIVLKVLRGEDFELLSREYSVCIKDIHQWRNEFINNGSDGFKPKRDNDKLSRAERKIGQLEMEIELIKKKNELVERLKKK